jgi:hypothetical protein
MLKELLEVVDVASVTNAVKRNVPVCDVMPEIAPLFLSSERPWGNDPPEICHE